MSKKLTWQQEVNLRAAIDCAEGPGLCMYHLGNRPGCVIGQLGVLEGASLKKLQEWDGAFGYGGTAEVLWNRGVKELRSYPLDLIRSLQRIWDSSDRLRSETARERMHALVSEYASGNGGAE